MQLSMILNGVRKLFSGLEFTPKLFYKFHVDAATIGAIAPGTEGEVDLPLPGVREGDFIWAIPLDTSTIPAGTIPVVYAQVEGPDIVEIVLGNYSAAPVSPGPIDYLVLWLPGDL